MLKKEILFTFLCVLLFHFYTPDTILYSQNQTKVFTKVAAPSTPNNSAGCGWIDYDNNDTVDAYLTFFNIAPQLFSNSGNGTFQAVTQGELIPSGNNFSGFSWGDYDNNGFPDLYITNMGGGNVLYRNSGDGHFQNAANSGVTGIGGSFLSSNWVDYDNDGSLDLFVTASGTGFTPGPGNLNFLFKNNTDGTFTRVTDNALATQRTFSSSAAFGDMDNDGDQDLFMTEWGNDNWLFENNGEGGFIKIGGTAINSNTSTSITANWGDYDNDGYLDLFVGNGSTSKTVKQKSYLFHNNGDKTFVKVTEGDVVNNTLCVWTSAWGDVDNDGDLDLYVGTIYDKTEQLYLNNGDGTFTATAEFDTAATAEGTGVTGASFGDYDNDGFLDLLVADVRVGNPLLFHNNGNDNHWITINCKGTMSNNSAIGARAKIKATISGKSVWQMRDITGVQGFRGSNDLRAHFGLGDAAVVDSLVIEWPSKEKTVQTNVPVNQFLSIKEVLPTGYLRPLFKADVTTGFSPLNVQFTDISLCDENNPITSWSWDFDGDGVEDSNEKNPVHCYDIYEGKAYAVALTVSNGSRSEVIEKGNYIKVIPLWEQNVALLKKATASSVSSPSFPVSNAIDGKLYTGWRSSLSDTQWIQIELDSAYRLEKIVIQWGSRYGKHYAIQSSQNGTDWLDRIAVDTGNGTTDEFIVAPFQAKYIRVNATANSSTTPGYIISEVEMYRPTVTEIKKNRNVPAQFSLAQNYPNPFNPVTTIRYQLPVQSHVELKVFDLLGREVSTLVNDQQAAGEHEEQLNGSNLSSGVYLYRIKAGGFIRTQKMMLVK